MHFDGLIFDLDGTLWDCSKLSADAFNLAYEKFGLNQRVSEAFVKSISGKPSSECDEILLADVPITMRQELACCFEELEIAAIQDGANSALYPDVYAGLEKLKAHYKLFVVSNCGERYLEIFLSHTKIGSFFSDSECFGRTQKLKHENIKALIARQNLASACYIGDTAGDETAAGKAGVPFFHAGYGFGVPVGKPIAFANFGELTRHFIRQSGGAESVDQRPI